MIEILQAFFGQVPQGAGQFRLAQGVESMLRVEAAQDTDGSYGSFEFASREQPVGQALRRAHQADLLDIDQ